MSPDNPGSRADNTLIYCPPHQKDTSNPMSKSKKSGSRLVYSTDAGRLCPQCHRPVAECVCGRDRPPVTGDGVVRLHRETKGRGGKAVTVIKGIPLAGAELKALARVLKQKCGVGGALKDENIEIMGAATKNFPGVEIDSDLSIYFSKTATIGGIEVIPSKSEN